MFSSPFLVNYLRANAVRNSEQLAEWQASKGMIQKFIPQENHLLQMSWGELTIWSKTFELLNTVRIFDRVATDTQLVNGILVCCGRDAINESDVCGLESGLKGWEVVFEKKVDYQKSSGEIKEVELLSKTRTEVFHIGPPVRVANGLEILNNGRVVVCVVRGLECSIDIWQV